MPVKDTRAVSAPRYVLVATNLMGEAGTAFARAAVQRHEVEAATYDFTSGRLRMVSVDKDLLDNVAAALSASSDKSGCTSVVVRLLEKQVEP